MTIYTKTARFDTGRAMTHDELRKVAPSIFAVDAHESRSERFAAIPTIHVLDGLAKEGFFPVGAMQSKCRTEDRKDFTKHMIRLRRFDDAAKYQVGDTVCEMILKNANDGSSAYDLLAGLFRICCLNSLVAQTGTIDSVKVRHSGDAVHKVIEGTYRVLGEAQKALEAPVQWSTIQLSGEAKTVLANAAHQVRFADAEGNIATPIKPHQLLIPRRSDDRANDLWTTFNVLQENVIRGGLTAIGRDANNRPRRSTTRGVNGIDQHINLNKALWQISEHFAKHAVAA